MIKNILFIGGDNRMTYAFEEFKLKGYCVSSLGLFPADDGKIEDNDAIILPVPVTRDKINVSCPLTDSIIPIERVLRACKGKPVFGGCFKGEDNFTDYCELDDYCLLNAVPTAEGAIAFAIENTPHTLWQSRVLVIGNGRVGKILTDRLLGLCCDVTVSARKPRDFALLKTKNINYINSNDVIKNAQNFDIIFNTIDVEIFKDPKLIPKNTLLIDLSTLGCTNFSAANELGANVYKLPGIPGKNAPKTAGKILAQTLMELLQ